MNPQSSNPTSSNSEQSGIKKNIQQIKPWLYRPKKSQFGMRRTYKYNDQHWTTQQNSRYAQFLTQFIDLFKSDPNKKRKYHLNRMVSKFVGTRSPIQCRSHHQRMLKTYGTLQNIVREVSKVCQDDAQVQKSVETDEIEQSQQKSEDMMDLPELQILSFEKMNQKSSSFFLEMFDSQEIILNNFFDL